MNFGNPERPRIMGQFVGCIDGMRAAAEALDYPVVSGNVSLYNETNGQAILPTPVIGGVGLIDDAKNHMTLAFKVAEEAIVVIGAQPARTGGWLGQSLYAREIHGLETGAPPPVDLAAEKRHGDFIRHLIASQQVTACHDIADGGLLVAVTEMALAGGLGARLEAPATGAAAWAFGEDQARYVVTARDAGTILAAAAAADVPAEVIGHTQTSRRLNLGSNRAISIDELGQRHEGWLPRFMGGEING